MSASLVNLDALISRADFDNDPQNPPPNTDFSPLKTHDLKLGSSLLLRKPDFQRETSHWSPEKVRDLVVAFASEDLVPSVIMWRSPSNEAFVIDGAHRLSSLIAWVNNDYGDGVISQELFGPNIDPDQLKAAEKARKLVHEAVGPFREIDESFKTEKFIPGHREISSRLNFCTIIVQTLRGDTEKAENSFIRINRQGVKLDPTELTLIFSRTCPNSVAARAINQNGAGHPHWKDFPSFKEEIEKLAKETHHLFFRPLLTSAVVKSTDVPIGGKSKASGVLSMLVDAVNISNELPTADPKSKEEAERIVPPDLDGSKTVAILKRTKKIMQRIHSDDPSSLGLDPFVYFYSFGGRHLPSSMLATIKWLTGMEKENSYKQFTRVRAAFEDFLVTNSSYIPQIVRKMRGEIRAVEAIAAYFRYCVREFQKPNATAETVADLLISSSEYSYLKSTAFEDTEYGKEFSSAVKSGATIGHHLQTAIRCDVCHARLDYRAISHDHSLDKSKGGMGNPENRDNTHRYCNSAKAQLLPFFAANGGIVE